MAYNNILLEEKEEGVFLLSVNRPKSFNALNTATLAEILAAGESIARNSAARVLLVTGSGEKAFVAGADISEMQPLTGVQGREFSRLGMAAFRRIETLPVPAIALVNGYCLGGGCELAMACDWIIAAENAVFGQPEVNLGICPGIGGTQRLPRLIGRGRAMELLSTGRQIMAAEALEWGLANHVYPVDRLLEEGLKQARMIVDKGPLAIQFTKESVQRGQDMDLDNACTLESELFGLCFSTEDQKEGMQAFLEKRTAVFRGK